MLPKEQCRNLLLLPRHVAQRQALNVVDGEPLVTKELFQNLRRGEPVSRKREISIVHFKKAADCN